MDPCSAACITRSQNPFEMDDEWKQWLNADIASHVQGILSSLIGSVFCELAIRSTIKLSTWHHVTRDTCSSNLGC